MRIRHLKLFSAVTLTGSTLLFGAAFAVWTQPYPDLMAREIPPWQPGENFATAGFAGTETPAVLSEALARPLFRRSRRPFDPAKVALSNTVSTTPVVEEFQPELPPPDASQLLVKGIVIRGQERQALITTPESPEGIWLPAGADIMGWKITELGFNGVTLSAGKHSVQLKLYVDNGTN